MTDRAVSSEAVATTTSIRADDVSTARVVVTGRCPDTLVHVCITPTHTHARTHTHTHTHIITNHILWAVVSGFVKQGGSPDEDRLEQTHTHSTPN